MELLFRVFKRAEIEEKGPSPETMEEGATCYREALKLAPDYEPAISYLLRVLNLGGQIEEAEQAAKEFLRHKPNSIEIWRELVQAQLMLGKGDDAEQTLTRMLEINPLDRITREIWGKVAIQKVRQLVSLAKLDEAKKLLAELSRDASGITADMCQGVGAVVERLIAPRAAVPEEAPIRRPALAYVMMVEAIRLKGPKKFVDERRRLFDEMILPPVSATDLAELFEALQSYRAFKPAHRGITADEKKIVAGLRAWLSTSPPAAEIVRLGMILLRGRSSKPLLEVVTVGRDLYPDDPILAYLQGEQMILQRPANFNSKKVGKCFHFALHRLENARDDQAEKIRAAIEDHCQLHYRLRCYVHPDFDFSHW
jgi:tetratricopeptide (TPR) repeat protein